MGATNRTQNYNLPQFVGSDKPTWLGDFNGAMSSIDTQMKSNNDLGTTANTTANTALENAGNAQPTANTAQQTATNANQTATNALNKALENEVNIQKFNLNNFIQLEEPILTGVISGNGSYNPYNIMIPTIARDTGGNVFKFYGGFELTNYTFQNGFVYATFNNTGIVPKEDYYINVCGIKIGLGLTNAQYQPIRCKVKTNGTIEIELEVNSSFTGVRVLLFPCLYFNNNFGD